METRGVDFSDLKKVLDALLVKMDENEWKLTIYSDLNCYILEGKINGIERRWSIEEDEKDELKHHERLLWEIMEYFGFGGSKHDPERLRVIREKRDDG